MDVNAGDSSDASEAFRDAYASARYATVGVAVQEFEQEAEARAKDAIGDYLGVSDAAAAYYARRCLLCHRELFLHELLALDMPSESLAELVETVDVVGERELGLLDLRRGVVLVTLHYGLYSSLLLWWLARAVVRGLLDGLTILIRTTAAGQYMIADSRLAEFEAQGIWKCESVELFDREAVGPNGTVQALRDRLGPGAAVLVFLDPELRPASRSDSLRVRIGMRSVGLPRGAAWVAAAGPAAVAPVHIRPHRDTRHAVVFGSTYRPASGFEARAAVHAAAQHLVDTTIMADPSPWEGWLREGLVDLAGNGHGGD